MAELAPVSARERIISLDVLRGFALCGVLMGNLLWLYTGRFVDGPPSPPTALDKVAVSIFGVLVENKAMTLLTFLFGFGFANILVRAEQRGETGTGVFVRRLVVLLLIGWVHVAIAFIDITWNYAVIGFGLLLFRRTTNGVRIACGLLLALAPFPLWRYLDGWRSANWFMAPGDWDVYARQWVHELRSAGWLEMMRENAQMALVFQAPMFLWNTPSVLGRFLLGYAAGAARWFDRDGADHLALFRRFAIGGLLVGLPCAGFVVTERLGVIADLGYEVRPTFACVVFMLELLGMATAYVGIVVLLVQRPRAKRVLSLVAPVGRMALTTYVMQSVIAVMLFSARGLGWRTPGAAAALGLALAIFAIQLGIAQVWLRYFRFGPLEWLWRSLVYMKRQPMRV